MADETDPDVHWLKSEGPDDWVPTQTRNLYARNGSDAAFINDQVHSFADEFPAHIVVVTGGPYRGHQVQWERITDCHSLDSCDVGQPAGLIHLDFYSVTPGYHKLGHVADDIEALIRLPDGVDDFGIEPFAARGFHWLKRVPAAELEPGDYIASDGESVHRICNVVEEYDDGQLDRVIVSTFAEQLRTGLLGTVRPIRGGKLEVPDADDEPDEFIDFIAANISISTLDAEKQRWTLKHTGTDD